MATLYDTPIAGIDLAVTRRADAEDVAERLTAAACTHDVTPDRVVVGIHRAVAAQERPDAAFTFSVHIDDADADGLWSFARRMCDDLRAHRDPDAGATHDEVGAALGRRRHGSPRSAAAASAAAREHESRSAGRVVSFAGRTSMSGPMQVADIVSTSAIDEVVDLAGGVLRDDDLVLVCEPVRPRWQFGSLVLHVLAAPGTGDAAVYLPFDRRGPSRLPA